MATRSTARNVAATGHILLISAAIAVVGIIAAVLLRPVTLRSSLDLPGTARTAAVAADAVDGAPPFDAAPAFDGDRVEADVEPAGRHGAGA